jgi:hypothetical protein
VLRRTGAVRIAQEGSIRTVDELLGYTDQAQLARDFGKAPSDLALSVHR